MYLLGHQYRYVYSIVLSHCDDLAHSDDGGNDDDDDDENEVVIQPSRFELLVLGAIIATFAVVLLLVTCLLVIILNKSSGGAAIVFEYEPSKCVSQTGPVIRSKAGVEDVTLSRVHSLLCNIVLLLLLMKYLHGCYCIAGNFSGQ